MWSGHDFIFACANLEGNEQMTLVQVAVLNTLHDDLRQRMSQPKGQRPCGKGIRLVWLKTG